MSKQEHLEAWRATLEDLVLDGTMQENRDKLQQLVDDYDEFMDMDDEEEYKCSDFNSPSECPHTGNCDQSKEDDHE